eukprot:TRINITY_DN6967_c0_g1_i1.p1 TRINITY_DN6967_c0_g1~~TRINITY_DN6967_c0_g1_i1.p1  ORF type:complete len:1824 (-),score=734.75 TRINITY_DN6967_c0_g1_i1:21-5492(-)
MDEAKKEIDELLSKATALLTLKSVLGDTVFQTQKEGLISRYLETNPSIVSAAQALKQLSEISFITASEVIDHTTKLLSGSVNQAPKSDPKEQAKPQESSVINWDDTPMTWDTEIGKLKPYIARRLKISEAEADDLVTLLNNISAVTVRHTIDLDKTDRDFGALDDLMLPEQKQGFKAFIKLLEELPFIQQEISRQGKQEVEVNKGEIAPLEHGLHLWSDDAQILIIPNQNRLNYFCMVDLNEDEAAIERKGEHLFFFLDISASMNHDAKGSYQAPKSKDHPDSSIKKARDLIPILGLAAIKRQASVTIVPWNYKIGVAIDFTPDQFMDPVTNEMKDDKSIQDELTKKTSDEVFVAKGGTNIEAALKEISRLALLASQKASTITVWFLTDGEETVFDLPNGAQDRIPSNPRDPKFAFFAQVDETGMTQYQRQMAADLKKNQLDFADSKCQIDMHVCHMGEAHPIFLKALRDSVDGHFHALKDVSKLIDEMQASSVGSGFSLEFHGISTGKTVKVSAANSDGALVSRGNFSQDLWRSDVFKDRSMAIKAMGTQTVLNHCENYHLTETLRSGIEKILALEPALDKILKSVQNDVTAGSMNKAAGTLRDLRNQRSESIPIIARLVRSGTILQAYLEKVLDSVENQIDALERLLEQHNAKEGAEYDKKSVHGIDLFSQRDKLAIEAGIESMRVRLGNGIVSQTFMDKKIQKLMATYGAWARKLLARICRIAQTVRGDSTLLTLFILNGDSVKTYRHRHIEKLAMKDANIKAVFEDPTTVMDFKEKIFHNSENEVMLTLEVTLKGKSTFNLKDELPFKTLFGGKCMVAEYFVQVENDDLDDAEKRFMDPLSFTSFLDLIRENNTLPAYLYSISTKQSMGILFNAKEQLHVVSGGNDSTSFDYFRLYWRLAAKDNNTKEVLCPGTFFKANCALPIAPEPLTSLVLSNLMPGLLSEFITGSPMAPLTGIGIIYVGYLNMHMRNSPITGVDISRIAEIMATLSCWVDNPQTLPKPEEFQEIVDSMVKNQKIRPAESSGRIIPIKAVAFGLIDTKHEPHQKLSAIQVEAFKRMTKQIIVPRLVDEKNLPMGMAGNQIVTAEIFKKFILDISEDKSEIDDVPQGILDTAEEFVRLANLPFQDSHLEFILKNSRWPTILKFLRHVIFDVGNKAFPGYLRWENSQRLFYVWHAISSYPFFKLKETFRNFKSPEDFEKHVAFKLKILQDFNFQSTVEGWIDPSSPQSYFVLNFSDAGDLQLENLPERSSPVVISQKLSVEECRENPMKFQCVMRIWNLFMQLASRHGGFWKGKKSNCYSLMDIDYDVVMAIKDSSKVEMLNPTQVAEYTKAKEFKNAAYEKFVGPKPVVRQLRPEDNIQVKPEAMNTGKPRLCAVMIGHIDAGKSTTAGHMIYKTGRIDKHSVQRIEKISWELGKGSFKWAWIMDQLKNERELGLTVDTSTWNIPLENFEVDLIDAPGHADFIKNMAVGSSMADVAILLVSAAPGEFEAGIAKSGTTREEALVAYASGIKQFIVAINKMDSVKYEQQRFDEISSEIRRYLMKVGVLEKNMVFVPVCSFLGENLVEPSENFKWYKGFERESGKGITLIEALNTIPAPNRPNDKPLRVPIVKAYKIGGIGTVAIGRIVSGVLRTGDNLVVQPGNYNSQAKSIEIFHSDKEVATAGDIIGFNLKNVALKDIQRGMVASLTTAPVVPAARFLAQIVVLNHPGEIRKGYVPYCFAHTATFPGKFVEIQAKVDRRTGKVVEDSPKSIKAGDAAIVLIEPIKPVCVEVFAEMPPLGRLIGRDMRQTVFVGVVKEVFGFKQEKKEVKKAPSKYFR